MNNRNQLAPTPPMGWNSWDTFGVISNEDGRPRSAAGGGGVAQLEELAGQIVNDRSWSFAQYEAVNR